MAARPFDISGMWWVLLGLALVTGVVALGFARARKRTSALRMMATQFGLV